MNIRLVVLQLSCLLLFGCSQEQANNNANTSNPTTISPAATSPATAQAPEPGLTKVRFGMLPYGDHSYAIIGVKKGFFKDAGIDLAYETLKVEDVVPYLKNGSVDVASCPPSFLFASYEMAPNLVNFAAGDLFQGYCIMAQPDGKYKSYAEFVASGMKPSDALKAAVQQMKGKTFAYPAEAAIKPFINIALQKGGLSRNDFKSLVFDDPLTVNAMRKKEADFQVGGAPSRILLQREGFKPILSSTDIAHTADPSPKSKELASVLEDGWATTREYYKNHHDTILRMAGVNFRITRFMHNHQQEALEIHMPFLSQITGQKFSPADGKIIYDDLDPFVTFEQQRDWFDNPKSLWYYKNADGSALNDFIGQGIYKKTPPKLEDVIFAKDIYEEMAQLKAKTDVLLAKLAKSGALSANSAAKAEYDKARQYYDAYDFLDAEKQAELASSDLKMKP